MLKREFIKIILFLSLGIAGAFLYDHFIIGSGNHPVERIDIKEASKFYEQHDALFIDARDVRFYTRERIAEALSLPYPKRDHWREQLADVAFEQTLIIYCGSEICSLSALLAEYLQNQGFKRVYILSGGIDAWREQGLPLVTAAN